MTGTAESLVPQTTAAPVDPDNYISCGDRLIATSRAANGKTFQGRVIAIQGDQPGRREFVLELDGQHWLNHGAIGLPENVFVFQVSRGDCWIHLPLHLLPEEAEKKVERSQVNTKKRIEKAVPLFADQIEVPQLSADQLIANWRTSAIEQLHHDHQLALQSTALRSEVLALVTPNQMETLDTARNKMPGHGTYGLYFWRRQLKSIQDTGQPDIFIPKPPINERINIPWLNPDAQVLWTTGNTTKPVRVLFIGNTEILVKLIGQPITDYDPRLFPNGNIWVTPAQLSGPMERPS